MRMSLWEYCFPFLAVFLSGSADEVIDDIRYRIFLSLQRIKASGSFAYGVNNSLLPNPGLHLPASGTLGLPLSTKDAKKIIAEAHLAPFGKGEKTLVDNNVRKSWELNSTQFQLQNPAWKESVDKIAEKVAIGLGFDKKKLNVSAELYKLLLYEPGSFFKPHRDSEKAPGMFATLVVCLPSSHEEGKLVAKHNNKTFEFDTATSSKFGYSYVAWFSDVTHEVQPIVSGYRLVLTYNLIRKSGSELPSYHLLDGRVKELSSLLEEYESHLKKGNDTLPPILLHKLEHKYTHASLKLDSLKPPDLGQVQILGQLSAKLGFGIYLATLELYMHLEENYYVDDTYEDHNYGIQTLREVVELDGKLVRQELKCPHCVVIDYKSQKEGPIRRTQWEPVGNNGCQVEFWYQDTVVVLVPPSKQKSFDSNFPDQPSRE